MHPTPTRNMLYYAVLVTCGKFEPRVIACAETVNGLKQTINESFGIDCESLPMYVDDLDEDVEGSCPYAFSELESPLECRCLGANECKKIYKKTCNSPCCDGYIGIFGYSGSGVDLMSIISNVLTI